MSEADVATMRPVLMSATDWLRVDGVMDNEIRDLRDKSWESDDPDELNPHWVDLAELGESIREAGWAQISGWPRTEKGFRSWPVPGQEQRIILSARQWGLVVSALERWAALAREEGDVDDAATVARIAAVVRSGFAGQDGGTVPAVRADS